MARDFTKNTSNYMTLGADAIGTLINTVGAVSVHAWINPDSYDSGAFDNRILTGFCGAGFANILLAVDGSGGNKVLAVAGRSRVSDSFQSKVGTTDLGTGTYKSVGAVFDYGAATITPYISGTAEGGGSVTWGTTAYDHTVAVGFVDGIGHGGTLSTATQFDGRIAELAIWDVALTSGDFTSLAGGAAANTVDSGNLIVYMRIIGTDSPETDLINGFSGTITGSLPQDTHPTITTTVFKRHPGMDGMTTLMTGNLNG